MPSPCTQTCVHTCVQAESCIRSLNISYEITYAYIHAGVRAAERRPLVHHRDSDKEDIWGKSSASRRLSVCGVAACVCVCSFINPSSNPSLCHCITLGPFHNLLSPQFSFLLLHHLFITPLTSLLAPLIPRSTGPVLHFHRLAALKNSFSFLPARSYLSECNLLNPRRCTFLHFTASSPPPPQGQVRQLYLRRM